MSNFTDAYNKLMSEGKVDQARLLANQTVGIVAKKDEEIKEMHKRLLDIRKSNLPKGYASEPVKVECKPQNVKRFELLNEECALLYARKNKDYGDSFNKSLDEDGLIVGKIRLGDKYNRYCQLIKNPAEVKEEKLRDTLLDMANYAKMLVMWLDEKEEQNRMKEMMSNMYAPVSPVISPKTPIADAQELWNLKDPFVNPVKNLKHNDALDSMSYGVKNMYPINAGADMDGDVFATTEAEVYPVACDNLESDTEDKPPVNNYNIHVHAGAEVDNNAVSKIIKGIQNIGKHM